MANKIVTLRGGPCDGEQIDSDGVSDILPSGHHLPVGYNVDRRPVYSAGGSFKGYIDTTDWSESP